MHAERWVNMKDILADALKLQGSERASYIEKANLTSEMQDEVESLLAVEAGARDFMSVSAGGFSGDFVAAAEVAESNLIGERLSVYEIIRELGTGGMGTVFLGTRVDGKFEQQVAVKLLRREFNIDSVRAAFDREIGIQASLVHPNIAKILDTGTTTDAAPYIVMEYVEGTPIDKFCTTAGLGLNERLKLFIKACEAVSYAHQNLIVHRDLKPSNIIVTTDGVPKLLDFGISGLLDSAEGKLSETGMLAAMTPDYASPEHLAGGKISTATDIYSLGVILFKLLTGTYPRERQDGFGGGITLDKDQAQPIRPSDALERQSGRADSRTGRISASELRGDIDSIVLKALERAPEDRYRTVERFTEDVWRFVDGFPVSAQTGSITYRSIKFVRRHKASAIAAALLLLTLVSGVAASSWQASVARSQAIIATDAQNRAEIETEKAKAEQLKSEKISKFMAKVISYANPAWYGEGARFGGDARVIDALDDLSDKIDIEFDGEADIQSELHHKFGEVFLMAGKNLTEPDRSKRFFERRKFHALRALDLRKQFYGDWHELVAKDIFYSYGYLDGEQAQAATLAHAIEMMRATNPQNLNLPYMLEAYSASLVDAEWRASHAVFRDHALPRTDENRYQIAERYLIEALPIFRLHYKEDNLAIYSNECRLAYVLAVQEKWNAFDEHYKTCRRSETALHEASQLEQMRPSIALVQNILAEKQRP